jgi:hypothetical protein
MKIGRRRSRGNASLPGRPVAEDAIPESEKIQVLHRAKLMI